MEIKLNGKALLGIALLSVGLAFGDYVSLINAKSSGGIIVSQPDYTVGAVVLRMDDTNPSDLYGGTWELITGDATLAFGDGSVMDGSIIGNNTPAVPLVQHSHTRGSMEIYGQLSSPGYQDTSVGYSLSGNGAFAPYGGKTVIDKIDGGANQGSIYRSVDFRASRNWSGSTSSEGVQNATLDVRGQRIKINVWKRVS